MCYYFVCNFVIPSKSFPVQLSAGLVIRKKGEFFQLLLLFAWWWWWYVCSVPFCVKMCWSSVSSLCFYIRAVINTLECIHKCSWRKIYLVHFKLWTGSFLFHSEDFCTALCGIQYDGIYIQRKQQKFFNCKHGLIHRQQSMNITVVYFIQNDLCEWANEKKTRWLYSRWQNVQNYNDNRRRNVQVSMSEDAKKKLRKKEGKGKSKRWIEMDGWERQIKNEWKQCKWNLPHIKICVAFCFWRMW